MVSFGRHPKNAINAVIRSLPSHLVVDEIHKGHRWGLIRCTKCGATQAIWSTPKSPDNHANQLRRFVQQHTH